MNTPWTGPRTPYADPVEEAARTEAYWAWLDAQETFQECAFVGDAEHGKGTWRQLTTADQADYEAREMRHSIGHSWDKYSAMGEIYSYRNMIDVPQMTVMVINNVVVHAREHQNTRLSVNNLVTLMMAAHEKGWAVKPDRFRMEAMFDASPEAVNTQLVCVQRDDNNAKTFFTTVLTGTFSEADAQALHDAFGTGVYTSPILRLADLPRNIFGDPKPNGLEDLEIVSLRQTAKPPTTRVQVADVVKSAQTRDKPVVVSADLRNVVCFENDNALSSALQTAHPVCAPQKLICNKIDDRRVVLSYVIKDVDSPDEAFWENTSGNGTFFTADGFQVSLDTPRDGDVALFVHKVEENGQQRFFASDTADGRLVAAGSYYPPQYAQDAYVVAMNAARTGAERRAAADWLITEADGELSNFADFVNGDVYAIVHETWEVDADDIIARTDVQLTTACIGYTEAWELIEDDVENDYELCGIPGM